MGPLDLLFGGRGLAENFQEAELIRNLPPLYTLVEGIAQAAQGISLDMGLALVVLYMGALLGVNLVGLFPRGLHRLSLTPHQLPLCC